MPVWGGFILPICEMFGCWKMDLKNELIYHPAEVWICM